MAKQVKKPIDSTGLSPRIGPSLCLLLIVLFLAGCVDPVTTHSIRSFFFDGVPELPTLDKLCAANMDEIFPAYFEKRIAESISTAEDLSSVFQEDANGSVHPPFRDKQCLNCHDFTKGNILQLPADKLCFKCHKNFIKGPFVHGPVAVADCLACHFPHQSANRRLLRLPVNAICGKCHQERRQAEGMHFKVIGNGMFCVDCHNPHSGKIHYFLK